MLVSGKGEKAGILVLHAYNDIVLILIERIQNNMHFSSLCLCHAVCTTLRKKCCGRLTKLLCVLWVVLCVEMVLARFPSCSSRFFPLLSLSCFSHHEQTPSYVVYIHVWESMPAFFCPHLSCCSVFLCENRMTQGYSRCWNLLSHKRVWLRRERRSRQIMKKQVLLKSVFPGEFFWFDREKEGDYFC